MGRNYYRAFFTLKEENPSLTKAGRVAVGKCIVERTGQNGRASVYIQDLKPQVNYNFYLVRSGEDKSFAAFLGALEIDQRNRCDARFEFDADNAGGYGYPIEEYDVAAVISPGRSELFFPLVGYKTGYVNFTSNLIFEPEINTIVEPAEEYSEISQNMSFDEEKSEDTEPMTCAEAKTFTTPADTIDEAITPQKPIPSIETTQIKSDGNEEALVIKNIFSHNTPMAPFGEADDDGVRWVRLSLSECCLFAVPRLNHNWNLFVTSRYFRFNHLIIGAKETDGSFIYTLGIPDLFEPSGYSHANKLGFELFKPCGEPLSPGACGYWLKILS